MLSVCPALCKRFTFISLFIPHWKGWAGRCVCIYFIDKKTKVWKACPARSYKASEGQS